MAGEQLLDSDQLFASFPDNVAGAIGAVDMRSFVLSVVPMIGTVDDGLVFTAPMSNGVPTVMNPLLPAPILNANYWTLDANQAFIPNYPVGVGIPPGAERLMSALFVFIANQVGGGTNSYAMQIRVGGVPINAPIPIDVAGLQQRFAINTEFIYDVSSALPVDVQITPDTNNDLDVQFSYMRLEGALI